MKITFKRILLSLSFILLVSMWWQIQGRYLFRTGDNSATSSEYVFREIVKYADKAYVDEVDWNKAMEGAIQGFLSNLDPHSVYFSEKEVMVNEENFSGKYKGIGIQFDIIEDTLTVIAPIPDSPSDKLGLMAGDRIIQVGKDNIIGISTSDVQKLLKGEKGTSVKITIKRAGIPKLIDYTIVRDEIPIYTVNTYFLMDDKTGYIFLNRFAKTTADEIDQALFEMERNGLERLVLDLRWNAGGYLDQAVRLASKFISGHKKIVYTKGRIESLNEEYFADTFGEQNSRMYPVIVLINHASASASEIVAGALQDYDRGLVAGERSFGKGLVQREFPLSNEGRLRLTISKYYTPSGRLIQRPYKGKDIEEYYMDSLDSASISQTDSVSSGEIYYTAAGRPVFGGGGITPDVEIKYSGNSKSPEMTRKFYQKRLFFEVASHFAAGNQFLTAEKENFINEFDVSKQLLNELKKTAKNKGIDFTEQEFETDREYLKIRLKAEIARSLWDNNTYYRVLIMHDNQFLESVTLFNRIEELLTVKNDPELP